MWKLAFVGSCLLFCLTEAQDGVPALGYGALKGYCNTNSDCGKKECCVSFATPRGKRAVAEPSAYIKQFAKGRCEKHGKSGSECLIASLEPPTGMYYHSCPCCVGYACRGNGQFTPPIGELGTCEKECSSCTDCGPSECCVSNSRIIGKRSAKRVKRQAQGYCKPMGNRGSECLVSNGSGRPHETVLHSCPCKKSLTCVWTGKSEVPLGKLGRCGHNQGY